LLLIGCGDLAHGVLKATDGDFDDREHLLFAEIDQPGFPVDLLHDLGHHFHGVPNGGMFLIGEINHGGGPPRSR
jgi:hypothetical protein